MSRPPHGGRGLKYGSSGVTPSDRRSPPARGAWIEMAINHNHDDRYASPPARGAWIEITHRDMRFMFFSCRSPHGERGLKYNAGQHLKNPLPARGAWIEISVIVKTISAQTSLPARGAWIEMPMRDIASVSRYASLPARGAWIEITMSKPNEHWLTSLPARGAWIEIMMEGYSIYRMLSDRAKDLKAKADAK